MWICKLVSVLLNKSIIGRAARWVIPPLNEDMYMWITWNMGSIPTGDRKNIPLPQFFLRIMVYVDRSVLCSTMNSSFVQLGWYCLLGFIIIFAVLDLEMYSETPSSHRPQNCHPHTCTSTFSAKMLLILFRFLQQIDECLDQNHSFTLHCTKALCSALNSDWCAIILESVSCLASKTYSMQWIFCHWFLTSLFYQLPRLKPSPK